jgi:hypothetical protein
MPSTDLVVEAFLLLRDAFFDNAGNPKPFHLRDKKNTQDDPLDEHIVNVLVNGLKDAVCEKSSGPLISPDLTIYRPNLCNNISQEILRMDTARIVAIEVKKLERSASGHVSRLTGMDYNTTPPCGTVRVYDADDSPLDIRGFYLFVTQEDVADRKHAISALALCDGNILNEDFDLYLKITSQREKEIGLGTYGDGANRNRPMLIFSNPLGASALDRSATLVNRDVSANADSRLRLVYRIIRTTRNGESREFFAYRKLDDVPRDWQEQTLIDPFPQPTSRVSATQTRGKFRLPIRPVKR